MSNPYIRRVKKRSAGYHGMRSERRVAKSLGTRQTPASGALPGAKGDIRLERLLIEAKATRHGSIQIKKEWLDKITQEALALHKTPALMISFVMPTGAGIRNGDWVMVPKYCLE